MMNFKDIEKIIEGKIIIACKNKDNVISSAFSSDLMSDVLTTDTEETILITGLVNNQVIRTAEMADINYIIFARRKCVPCEVIELAKESGIAIMESEFSVFKISGLLYSNGIKPIF